MIFCSPNCRNRIVKKKNCRDRNVFSHRRNAGTETFMIALLKENKIERISGSI